MYYSNNISQYYYSYQINAALVNIRDVFKKKKKRMIIPIFWIYLFIQFI